MRHGRPGTTRDFTTLVAAGWLIFAGAGLVAGVVWSVRPGWMLGGYPAWLLAMGAVAWTAWAVFLTRHRRRGPRV